MNAAQARRFVNSQHDVLEKFVRAEGKGGQKVNKTSSCIYLKHVPTGIEVKCQSERSQARNRRIVRELLAHKVLKQTLEAVAEEQRLLEKARRRNRGRSKKAQARILQDKRKQSQRKALRSVHGQSFE